MKLHQDNSPVEISGAVSAPSGFKIANTKEAFKILSSGLYTNKIRAIIRELSCNAWDAHIAAGKPDVPFTVHLPTNFEPSFTIRDYGTGLEYVTGGCQPCAGKGSIEITVSQETRNQLCESCDGTGDYDAVKVLYTTYFATNKSNSNLFIGALGLGSKSPFCYTEGFSITNVYNGVTRVYSCYLDRGMPAVLLQTQDITPEAINGVEITFPVKQYDVWEFENQARHVWEFFYPRPNVNVPNLTVKQAEYEFRLDSWGLRKGSGQPRAIQGFVQYGLGDIDESKLNIDQKRLLKLPLDLFFPIGQLEVAASREALSNNDSTVDNILKALDGIKDELLKETKEKIMACKSLWEAKLLIYSLSNKEGIGPMISAAFKAGEFADLNPKFSLSDESFVIDQKDYPGLAIKDFKGTMSGRPLARTSMLTDEKKLPHESNEIVFTTKNDILFVINDLGFGTDKFIHWMLQMDQQNEIDTVYFLTKANKDVTTEIILDYGAQIILALGTPPYVMMSELKEKYQETMKDHNPYVYVPKTVLVWNPTRKTPKYSKGWRDAWKDNSNVELPEGVKYYLAVKAGTPTVGLFNRVPDFKIYLSLIRQIPGLGVSTDDPIYGIPTWYVSKLDESWVELTNHVKAAAAGLLTKEIQSQLAFHKQSFSSGMDGVLTIIHNGSMLLKESPLMQFIDEWVVAKKFNKTMITNLSFLLARSELQGIYSDSTNTIDFNQMWTQTTQTYPLLSYLSLGGTGLESVAHEVVRYVKFIDQDNQRQQETIDILELAVQQSTDIVSEEIEYAN